MNSDQVVVQRVSPGVLLIRINRPEVRNALNLHVRSVIAAQLAAASEDVETRCIVITGDQVAFAAGADIREMENLGAIEHMQTGTFMTWTAISSCTKPVIAAVNGFAMGGGFELALAADIIIAGKSARFALPEVRIGVMPGGGGTQKLMRLIGKHRAMKYCLTGASFSGEEAFAMGVASEVVEDAFVVNRALEMASTIAGFAPLAVQQIKEVLLAGQDVPLATALRLESKATQVLFASRDKMEGMKAFMEKRQPVWEGR